MLLTPFHPLILVQRENEVEHSEVIEQGLDRQLSVRVDILSEEIPEEGLFLVGREVYVSRGKSEIV